jgi:hypothetical protein
VIAVLLAPARVAACGLQIAARVGADPDVGVGRWNGECVDARDLACIADAAARGVEVREALAHALARDAGAAVAHVLQVVCIVVGRDGGHVSRHAVAAFDGGACTFAQRTCVPSVSL